MCSGIDEMYRLTKLHTIRNNQRIIDCSKKLIRYEINNKIEVKFTKNEGHILNRIALTTEPTEEDVTEFEMLVLSKLL